MERYESLGLVGEGSYGTVLKCRHRDSGRLVAIKKFMDSDDDKTVKKIALREIKLLKQLHHDNLVNLLEVWKRRRRWYLVFEFVGRTLLDDLEQNPSGLDLNTSRLYLYQILRATAFCHQQHVIHRDIKPENVLISQGGVVKLCDFGFARTMTSPTECGVYTDYVATRWYRAPELLVGDTKYGKPVDVWAVGCLLVEMLTGQPLFPGDSDLDQIYHIVRCFGNLTAHHQELFHRNPVFSGVRLPECSGRVPLELRFPTITSTTMDLAQSCLQIDPDRRAQCSELLEHPLFTQDSFHIRVLDELNAKIQKDHRENSTLPKIARTPKQQKDEEDDKNGRVRDKKRSDNMDEKVNKEKEKKNKESGEEKMPKTKSKKTANPPKTIWSTSEPLMSTKQSKASAAKVIDHSAKTTVATRGRLGKATGGWISKPTKTPPDLPATSKTATDLKDKNIMMAKPRYSPDSKECHPKNTNTKDRESTGLHSSCSDNTVSSATKLEPRNQDFGKNWNSSNTKVHKLSKSTNADHPKESSSPSLKSTVDPTNSNLKQKIGKVSTTEYPEGAATPLTSKISNRKQIETSFAPKAQRSTIDHIEVAIPTIPSVAKPFKTICTSELQTDSNLDREQRRTSECQRTIPSIPKTSKTTSLSYSKTTKSNTSLSTSPSKTLSSDHIEATPTHSAATLPKGTLQTSPSNRTNDTYVPNKPSREHPTDRELTEVFITTKNQQDGFTPDKDINEGHRCLTMSAMSKTTADHTEISHASGGHYQGNPESSQPCHQQSTPQLTTESERTSTSMSSEISQTTMSAMTTVPKTLKVSDKENREDLALSKVSRSSNVVQSNSSSETEPNLKCLKPSHCKSLIGEPKLKFGSLNKSSTTRTQKTRFSAETQKERNNPSFTSTVTPDSKAATRSSIPSNINEFDFSLSCSSPPPPPPPPSSTPLLLLPTSTPLIPSFSVIGTNSPAPSYHPTLGTGFHPGTHNLRCADKLRLHGRRYVTGSVSAQASEKNLNRERSFMSDCCNHGNSDDVTEAKRKSDIHLPDVRSSALPELRRREGKHSKGPCKDQRKDKQPASSMRPAEPHQLEHD